MKTIIRKIKHRGVAIRIIVILTLILAVFYGIVWNLLYSAYKGNAIQSLGAATEDAMISTGIRINDALQAKEKTTMQLYYDSYLEWMEDPASITKTQNDKINDALSSMRWSDSGMLACYVKSTIDPGTIWGGPNYKDVVTLMQPHEVEIMRAGGRCQWYWTYDMGGRAGECKFILARALNSKNRKNVGILYVIISYNTLTQFLRNLTSDSERYLVAGDGTVLYCSEPDKVQSTFDLSFIDPHRTNEYRIMGDTIDDEVLMAYRKMNAVNWVCVAKIDVNHNLYTTDFLTRFNLILILGLILLLLLMSYVLRRYVFKPVARLKRSMDEYADGSLTVTSLEPVGVGEFRSLSTHFNEMTSRIDSLMKAYREETEEKNRQSMLAMTAQMTPHFIYNALNTIRWMAIIAKQQNIQKLVESLNYMFMSAVRVDDDQYTIGDELTLIENYATIQKARFMNFDLLIEADENCRNLKIMKFLLQPVVENAIVHGLGRGEILDTNITVRVWRDQDLHIQVIDEGVGFDVEEWRKNPVRKDNHSNIGLQNVEKLITLSYGAPYCMTITSEKGKGTCVTYKLPAVEKGEAS